MFCSVIKSSFLQCGLLTSRDDKTLHSDWSIPGHSLDPPRPSPEKVK